MVKAIRAAFYKRGVPEQLLVDNGSIYCCQEITLICARVGCILRHTAVRDAAAKGKIERFFRRVRDQFLVRKLDLASLEELNKQFTHWVEQEYNATTNPKAEWVRQACRHLTDFEGFLNGASHLIVDRDTSFLALRDFISTHTETEIVLLPPKSPNLNAHIERWFKSLKSECLDRMIFFGQKSCGT